MNVIKFPSAIFSVDSPPRYDTAVDRQALAAAEKEVVAVVAAAGTEVHGAAWQGSTPKPSRVAVPAGLEPGDDSAAAESDCSSSEGDDEPDPVPVSTGFKLNLGKVAANEVDGAKPVAVPHTPKGKLVQELLDRRGSSSVDTLHDPEK